VGRLRHRPGCRARVRRSIAARAAWCPSAEVHAASRREICRSLPDDRKRQDRPAQARRIALMVPFDSFAYFAVLLYVLPVAVALRLVPSTSRTAIVLITIVMLAIQYGGVSAVADGVLVGTSAMVAAYAVYQWLLVAALAALARRRGGTQRPRPPRAGSD